MNFLRQVIQYSRTALIGNEKAVAAGFLSTITGFLPPQYRQSHIITGLHSSGKSATQNVIFDMLPEGCYLYYSSSSAKGIIDDPDLQKGDKRIIKLQEIEKIKDNNEAVEVLKSMMEWDGQMKDGKPVAYAYIRSKKGESAEKIILPVAIISVTTASQSIEASFLSRALEIPIDESKQLNKAVALHHFGEKNIVYNGIRYDLKKDVFLQNNIKNHVLNLPEMHDFVAPAGAPQALLALLDLNTSESRRHSKIIASLLFASALLNYEERKIEEDGFLQRICLTGQDIYNIFALREILTTMVYHLDKTDLQILRVIKAKGGEANTNDIYNELRRGDFSISAKSTVRNRLRILENAGLLMQEKFTNETVWKRTDLSIDINSADIDLIAEVDKRRIICPFTGNEYANIKDAFTTIAKTERRQKELFDF